MVGKPPIDPVPHFSGTGPVVPVVGMVVGEVLDDDAAMLVGTVVTGDVVVGAEVVVVGGDGQ